MKRFATFAVLCAALLLPAAASADPVLDVTAEQPPPAGIAAGGIAGYELTVANAGDAPTSDVVTVDVTLPAGLKAVNVLDEFDYTSSGFPSAWDCSIAPDAQSVSCVGPEQGAPIAVPAGEEACHNLTGGSGAFSPSCRIIVAVAADSGLALGGILSPTVEACGGGAAACANAAAPTAIAPPMPFGIELFDGGVFDLGGEVVTQAGAYPQTGSTTFTITQDRLAANGAQYSTQDFKDVIVDLPAGVVGNPTGVPTCTEFELIGGGGSINEPICPIGSQVGFITIIKNGLLARQQGGGPGNPILSYLNLFNMKAPKGRAALFGFNAEGTVYHLSGELLLDDSVPGDYRVRARTLNTPQTLALAGARATVWGVPADPGNDADRGQKGIASSGGLSCANPDHSPDCSFASPEPEKPFFTLPTSCVGPVETEATITGWQGGKDTSSFISHDNEEPPNPIGNDGCGALGFEPTLTARPTTDVADSPTGLDVELAVPQNEDPDTPATAHLKDTTVTLPEGLVLNPSGANGLDGCSEAEVGLDDQQQANCPDASRVGSVEVETPLLDHSVSGSVYVADPYDNPFDSLLALYLVLDDPQSGVRVKIAGETSLDPDTGRISSTFEENPQVPFESFELHFKAGAHAPLVTPPTCGNHTTRSQLSSWAQPNDPVGSTDSWSISRGPGAGCPRSDGSVPHLPSFESGTVSPIAGIHSPFVLNLRRPDGSARFGSLTVSPPPGLTATLAATPPCPAALLAAAERRDGRDEQRNPSCPLASRVGTVHAQAGAGPAPYNAPGTAYLAGPYKGAPLSLAIVTPAVAGPFDLGTVVIRTALHVNPTTAQITAVSDPIPSMLEGIPLNVRSASVRLDKPGFALNPTSCDPMLFGGTLTSTKGAIAQLIERFQLAECGRLGFKPRVNLRLFGGIKRAKYQGVRAVVRPRPGDANISRTVVRFPRSAFVAQEHIRTICTRVQWAAEACPKGSIYGKAIARSPLLSYPLEGNVYLRSSNNELPDAVADLRGPAWQPLRVEVAIRNDSVKGALRNTVQVVPDAPVSYFRLQLFGGKKGLIVNSRNICVGDNRAAVLLAAHNGARTVLRPNVLNPKCKKAKRKAKAKRRAAKRRAAKRKAARR